MVERKDDGTGATPRWMITAAILGFLGLSSVGVTASVRTADANGAVAHAGGHGALADAQTAGRNSSAGGSAFDKDNGKDKDKDDDNGKDDDDGNGDDDDNNGNGNGNGNAPPPVTPPHTPPAPPLFPTLGQNNAISSLGSITMQVNIPADVRVIAGVGPDPGRADVGSVNQGSAPGWAVIDTPGQWAAVYLVRDEATGAGIVPHRLAEVHLPAGNGCSTDILLETSQCLQPFDPSDWSSDRVQPLGDSTSAITLPPGRYTLDVLTDPGKPVYVYFTLWGISGSAQLEGGTPIAAHFASTVSSSVSTTQPIPAEVSGAGGLASATLHGSSQNWVSHHGLALTGIWTLGPGQGTRDSVVPPVYQEQTCLDPEPASARSYCRAPSDPLAPLSSNPSWWSAECSAMQWGQQACSLMRVKDNLPPGPWTSSFDGSRTGGGATLGAYVVWAELP